MLSVVMS